MLSREENDTFKELGPGYLCCAQANNEAHEQTVHIQDLIDKLNDTKRKKYRFPPWDEDDWPLSENGNIVDFSFARSDDHPEIAAQLRIFLCAPLTSMHLPRAQTEA